MPKPAAPPCGPRLIDVAARTARHGHGHITLHLPRRLALDQEWMNLFEAATDRLTSPDPVNVTQGPTPPGTPPR
jgi:hypothetical protein